MVTVLLIAGASASGLVVLSLVFSAIVGRRRRALRREDSRTAMFPLGGARPVTAPEPPPARTSLAAERIR
jgi:hypothetical protein